MSEAENQRRNGGTTRRACDRTTLAACKRRVTRCGRAKRKREPSRESFIKQTPRRREAVVKWKRRRRRRWSGPEESGKKRGRGRERERKREGDREIEREREGSSINCPALCGKLRFNSRIQGGATGKGARLPAGGARIHAVHDPHAFYMVTTWRRIASRCVKSGREAATLGKRPLIINRPCAANPLLPLVSLTFIVVIRRAGEEDTLKTEARRLPQRASELLFSRGPGYIRVGSMVTSRESR